MNWMTSGKKRLNKVSKGRERSFHFGAASRANRSVRATATRQPAAKQSADVSRLRMRGGAASEAIKASNAPDAYANRHSEHHASHANAMPEGPPSPFAGPLPSAACREYNEAELSHPRFRLLTFNDQIEVGLPEDRDHQHGLQGFQEGAAPITAAYAHHEEQLSHLQEQQHVYDTEAGDGHAPDSAFVIPPEVQAAVAGLSVGDTLSYLYSVLAAAYQSRDPTVQVQISRVIRAYEGMKHDGPAVNSTFQQQGGLTSPYRAHQTSGDAFFDDSSAMMHQQHMYDENSHDLQTSPQMQGPQLPALLHEVESWELFDAAISLINPLTDEAIQAEQHLQAQMQQACKRSDTAQLLDVRPRLGESAVAPDFRFSRLLHSPAISAAISHDSIHGDMTNILLTTLYAFMTTTGLQHRETPAKQQQQQQQQQSGIIEGGAPPVRTTPAEKAMSRLSIQHDEVPPATDHTAAAMNANGHTDTMTDRHDGSAVDTGHADADMLQDRPLSAVVRRLPTVLEAGTDDESCTQPQADDQQASESVVQPSQASDAKVDDPERAKTPNAAQPSRHDSTDEHAHAADDMSASVRTEVPQPATSSDTIIVTEAGVCMIAAAGNDAETTHDTSSTAAIGKADTSTDASLRVEEMPDAAANEAYGVHGSVTPPQQQAQGVKRQLTADHQGAHTPDADSQSDAVTPSKRLRFECTDSTETTGAELQTEASTDEKHSDEVCERWAIYSYAGVLLASSDGQGAAVLQPASDSVEEVRDGLDRLKADVRPYVVANMTALRTRDAASYATACTKLNIPCLSAVYWMLAKQVCECCDELCDSAADVSDAASVSKWQAIMEACEAVVASA